MASVWVGHRGTMRDHPGFNPSVDAEAIHKAVREIGTDEKTHISILTERSNAQRQLTVKEYQVAYGKVAEPVDPKGAVALAGTRWTSGRHGKLLVEHRQELGREDLHPIRNTHQLSDPRGL